MLITKCRLHTLLTAMSSLVLVEAYSGLDRETPKHFRKYTLPLTLGNKISANSLVKLLKKEEVLDY